MEKLLQLLLCRGHMPEGRINKITDLQKTKFLRLFGLTMCIISVNVLKCSSLYLFVDRHQHYALLA
jgi:hypothetical protein